MKFRYKILTLCCLSFFLMSSGAYAQFLPIANVVKISGTAFINREKIKVGAEIAEGEEIRVAHTKDYIDIKYQDGHVVRLQGGIIKVKALNPDKSVIELIKGTLYNLVKKLGKNDSFVVQTKRASFAVRGTKFYIEEKMNESYLCVCEGSVVVTNQKDKKRSVEVRIDQDLFVSDKRPFKATVSSQMMRTMGNSIFNLMK